MIFSILTFCGSFFSVSILQFSRMKINEKLQKSKLLNPIRPDLEWVGFFGDFFQDFRNFWRVKHE